MALPTPAPPVLFGATAAQREASRTADSLRFDWTDVAGAATYDIRFGAADVRTNVAKGDLLGGLPPNQSQAVRLRAVNGANTSAWSLAATFATRPDRPAAPFLDSPADRRENGLVINWNLVNGLPDYEMQVNGAVLAALVQPPFTLVVLPAGGPLLPNTLYDVAVRARDDAGGGTSEWSPVESFVTRPPRPAAPTRFPADLFSWGIVVKWNVADTFNGGASSFVRLFRDTGGAVGEKLVDGEATVGGRRVSRHIDVRQRMSQVKTYRVQTIVPAAAVPGPIPSGPQGGPENQSFESDELSARLPFCLTTLAAPKAFPATVVRVRVGLGETE